jgi:exodeoxyribonuclease VIII
MQNVMLDLETLGTRQGSVITSIGAVKFDSDGLGEEFYRNIEIESSLECGLTVDGGTIYWWLQQSEEARNRLCARPRDRLPEVLWEFDLFLKERNNIIWGNGSDFDNAMLSTAYSKCGMPLPWKYSNNRCYRTMKNMVPDVKLDFEGDKHNALDDAKHQARHLLKIWEETVF